MVKKTVQVQALSPIYCIAIKKNKFSAKKPSDNLDTGLRVYRKKKHMKHMHFRARA